jgi:hypothetical protein
MPRKTQGGRPQAPEAAVDAASTAPVNPPTAPPVQQSARDLALAATQLVVRASLIPASLQTALAAHSLVPVGSALPAQSSATSQNDHRSALNSTVRSIARTTFVSTLRGGHAESGSASEHTRSSGIAASGRREASREHEGLSALSPTTSNPSLVAPALASGAGLSRATKSLGGADSSTSGEGTTASSSVTGAHLNSTAVRTALAAAVDLQRGSVAASAARSARPGQIRTGAGRPGSAPAATGVLEGQTLLTAPLVQVRSETR